MNELFRKIASKVSVATGSPQAFCSAIILIITWLVTGPLFHYSDTWQLVINTFTTIVTFLMVFLIQNTQNRDIRAVHLKLDELLRGMKGARNIMIEVEELDDKELELMRKEYTSLHEKAAKEQDKRQKAKK